MRRLLTLGSLVLVVALFTLGAAAQSGGSFSIVRSVIGNGGSVASGGAYTLNGTVGQSAVGPSFGGTYALSSGYWTAGVVVPTAVQGLLGVSAETPIIIPYYLIALCTFTLFALLIRIRRVK